MIKMINTIHVLPQYPPSPPPKKEEKPESHWTGKMEKGSRMVLKFTGGQDCVYDAVHQHKDYRR